MEIDFGRASDLDSWMVLVEKVRWNFPGLETEQALQDHRDTAARLIGRHTAVCARENGRVVGVLLFSDKRNLICCLAVDPDFRRRQIASRLFSLILTVADPDRDILVSTFRENDPKGSAPRAFYKKLGFLEGELTEEFGYPIQKFRLPRTNNRTQGSANKKTDS